MKDVRINIHELGPIKDASILLAPFMIFTGQSNLGKSYVNFLSYYVFDFFGNNGLNKFLSPKVEGKKWKNNTLSFNFSLDDLRSFMSSDAQVFMRDMLGYDRLACSVSFDFEEDIAQKFNVVVKKVNIKSFNGADPDFTYDEISVSINDGEPSKLLFPSNDNISPILRLASRSLSLLLLGKIFVNSYLLPPGRTSLASNSFTVKQRVSNIGMYNRFLHDFDKILQSPDFNRLIPQKEDYQFFVNQIKKLIDGDVVMEKGELFFQMPGLDSIPMSAAASSIRELSPFLFLLKNRYWILDGSSICFEEPEAHAHPEMQYGIADLLASCVNKGAFIQMTTHSDYLLSRINQLIRLFNAREVNPEAFEKSPFIRNKRQLLNPKMIKAYYFSRKDGNVVIEEQQLEDGIPFDTFRQALVERQMFNMDLEKLIGDDDD